MKNYLRFLSVSTLLLLAVASTQARNTLTVYEDGDEPNYQVPINLLYLDEVGTHSQVIYPASMLAAMQNEAINSVTFYTFNTVLASGGKVRVSVGETTQAAYGSFVEGLATVATISITPGISQVVINFDTPFPYAGGNLVIDTYVEEAGTCSTDADLFVCYRADTYCSISSGSYGGVSKSIPKATFDYGADVPYGAKVLPAELSFNTVRVGQEDVQSVVLTNVGNLPFTPTFDVPANFAVDVDQAPLQPKQSLTVPVRFVPTAAGDCNAVLNIDCGQAGVLPVTLNATAWAEAKYLTVCDSVAVGTLPIDGVYIDLEGTQGQMIYPAEMLTDMVGAKIVEVKFYASRMKMNGGVITLSLMASDQSEYTETTLLTGLTPVATATPVKGSPELVFVFDEPFEYKGQNLVVDALVTTTGEENLESSTFYGMATDYYASLEAWNYYGYNVGFVSFLPKATFAYQKPEWMLGDVNHDGHRDVADVSLLINYILKGAATNFYLTEANCDGDEAGHIDVADVSRLINMILKGN